MALGPSDVEGSARQAPEQSNAADTVSSNQDSEGDIMSQRGFWGSKSFRAVVLGIAAVLPQTGTASEVPPPDPPARVSVDLEAVTLSYLKDASEHVSGMEGVYQNILEQDAPEGEMAPEKVRERLAEFRGTLEQLTREVVEEGSVTKETRDQASSLEEELSGARRDFDAFKEWPSIREDLTERIEAVSHRLESPPRELRGNRKTNFNRTAALRTIEDLEGLIDNVDTAYSDGDAAGVRFALEQDEQWSAVRNEDPRSAKLLQIFCISAVASMAASAAASRR